MFARQVFRSFQPTRQVRRAVKQQVQHRCGANCFQIFRKYSSEASKKRSLAPIYISIGLVGLAIGVYRYTQDGATAKEQKEREKVFTGGEQGWVDLKLGAIEDLSHNTKRFRFEFPDKDMISGLNVACKFIQVTEKRGSNSY